VTGDDGGTAETRGPHLFPREAFPITFRAYGVRSGTLHWEHTLEAPEGLAAVHIPALARQVGEEVRVEVELATGQVVRSDES